MKIIMIFLTGGTAYNIIEYMHQGYSHWIKAIDGGICFLGIHFITKHSSYNFIYKVLFSSALITAVELVSGIIINKILKLNLWDYSAMPKNLFGQIYAERIILWTALCIPAVILMELLNEMSQNS